MLSAGTVHREFCRQRGCKTRRRYHRKQYKVHQYLVVRRFSFISNRYYYPAFPSLRFPLIRVLTSWCRVRASAARCRRSSTSSSRVFEETFDVESTSLLFRLMLLFRQDASSFSAMRFAAPVVVFSFPIDTLALFNISRRSFKSFRCAGVCVPSSSVHSN